MVGLGKGDKVKHTQNGHTGEILCIENDWAFVRTNNSTSPVMWRLEYLQQYVWEPTEGSLCNVAGWGPDAVFVVRSVRGRFAWVVGVNIPQSGGVIMNIADLSPVR